MNKENNSSVLESGLMKRLWSSMFWAAIGKRDIGLVCICTALSGWISRFDITPISKLPTINHELG